MTKFWNWPRWLAVCQGLAWHLVSLRCQYAAAPDTHSSLSNWPSPASDHNVVLTIYQLGVWKA